MKLLKNKIGLGGLLISISFIYILSKYLSGSSSAGLMSLGQVEKRSLIQRVTVSGQIFPFKRMDIKPPFNGYVQKLFVHVGDKVKQRDPIVTFSLSLNGEGENFPLRAAFSGVVTQILKGEGEYVTETGDQNLVVRIDDISQLYILASVAELDIAKLKIGQEAIIKVTALSDAAFKGEVAEISLSAKDKERFGSSVSAEFQIRIKVNSRDPRLLPGMSAIIDVVTEERNNVLTLSQEFIQLGQDNQYFVTTSSGEKKPITVGLQTEEAVEIMSGLNEGDSVRVVDFLNSEISK